MRAIFCLLVAAVVLLLFNPNEAFKCRHLISQKGNINRLPANWNAFGITKRNVARSPRAAHFLLHQVTNEDEDTVVESNYLIAVAVILVAIVYDLYNMHGGVTFWAELKETMEGPLIE